MRYTYYLITTDKKRTEEIDSNYMPAFVVEKGRLMICITALDCNCLYDCADWYIYHREVNEQ